MGPTMAPGRWHPRQLLPTAQLRIEALEGLQGNGAVLGYEIILGLFHGLPGLVNIQKAIENGHRNSGFTLIDSMVDLSIVM